MDYKEKYEAALGWMQSLYDGLHGATKEDAEHYFPELLESKDESIRKTLIAFFRDWERTKSHCWNVNVSDIIAWLEKQGEKNPVEWSEEDEKIKESIKKHIFNANDWYVSKVDGKIHNMTYNPNDKFEPKFKVGDWITNGDYTWKIVEVKPLDYILQSQDGNIVDDTISYTDEHFHLWSIQDAKDGDVLNSPSHRLIWIYKDNKHYHVCVNMNYVTKNITRDILIRIPSDACPATKDERTILFEKTKEEGYEWDSEKKKLKKIEVKPLDANKVIE